MKNKNRLTGDKIMVYKNFLSKTILVSILSLSLIFTASCSAEKASANSNSTSNIYTNTSISQKESQSKSDLIKKFNLKEVKVSRTVDGDTIQLTDGIKVRLIGVNSPESTAKIERYGKEASNYTKSNLTGKTVYLEKDVSETDQYGRLLRYIWIDIPNEINDSEIKTKMFNAMLVENGYAQVSTYPPDVKYRDYFAKCNSEARNAKKGLWAINANGTTKGDTLSNYISNPNSSSTNKSSDITGSSAKADNSDSSFSKQSEASPQSTGSHGLIKGNINSSGEKIYHVPGGQFYDKTDAEQWFSTEQEAQAAGYRKSKR